VVANGFNLEHFVGASCCPTEAPYAEIFVMKFLHRSAPERIVHTAKNTAFVSAAHLSVAPSKSPS